MSEDVNFAGIDFDPFSGLKKNLKFHLVVWASSSHIILSWSNYLPGPSPIGEVNFESYLLRKKIYLSQTTKSDSFLQWSLDITKG